MAEESEQAGAQAPKILKLHDLRPAAGSHHRKMRVGRGEASKGKTAGRGTKGTKARNQVPAHFEGGAMPLHMQLPKLRGFKNRFRVEYQPVNLATLQALFPEGGAVTVQDLIAKGVVKKGERVKILGDGDVTSAFTVEADKWSASAQQKITKAGGSLRTR